MHMPNNIAYTFLASCGSRKLCHPVRFNDMAMIRVQSRAARAISLMETFRRYEHRTLVLRDECHSSRLSLFPILGDSAKHFAC